MHTHYYMFGFLDSPTLCILPHFSFFLFWLEKKSVASKHYAIFTKKILFVVKSLHNVEATDFFTSQNKKKEKYGKIHIVGSLKNQT